jgi:hypothetical protein
VSRYSAYRPTRRGKITGQATPRPGDFDLDLLETRTLDGRTQELVYRPTLRAWPAS